MLCVVTADLHLPATSPQAKRATPHRLPAIGKTPPLNAPLQIHLASLNMDDNKKKKNNIKKKQWRQKKTIS